MDSRDHIELRKEELQSLHYVENQMELRKVMSKVEGVEGGWWGGKVGCLVEF